MRQPNPVRKVLRLRLGEGKGGENVNIFKYLAKVPKHDPQCLLITDMRTLSRKLHMEADSAAKAYGGALEARSLRLRGDMWGIAAELVGALVDITVALER